MVRGVGEMMMRSAVAFGWWYTREVRCYHTSKTPVCGVGG